MKKMMQLMVLSLILACKRPEPSGQTLDADVQVLAQLKKVKTHDDGNVFMVRILPARKHLNADAQKITSNIQYKSDSSFYVLDHNKKIYPDYVQPIASGISGCYEFLVGFGDQLATSETYALVYQDQFINKKKYVLTIK